MMIELQVVGGGNMGEALVGGLLAAGTYTPRDLCIVELDENRRAHLAAIFEGIVCVDTPRAAVGVVLAVKPQHIVEVAERVAAAGVTRVLSIAAGVTLATLQQAVGAGVPVVRAMPNTPSLVRSGAAAIAGGAAASEEDLTWAEDVLGSVGTVVRVQEPLLDAVTGLSGSGPAYLFLLAEALIAAGVREGLSPEVSGALTRQTLLGAAQLLVESGDEPAALRSAVTSPGGTTAAGIAVFEERGFAELVADVVAAAAARSRELGTTP